MRPSAAALGTASPSHRHGTCGDSFVGWPLPMAEDTKHGRGSYRRNGPHLLDGRSQTCRGLCPLCRGRVTLSSFRKRFLISQRSRAFPAFPQLVICSKYRVPHTCMPNKTRQNSRKEKHNLANGSYFILFI